MDWISYIIGNFGDWEFDEGKIKCSFDLPINDALLQSWLIALRFLFQK